MGHGAIVRELLDNGAEVDASREVRWSGGGRDIDDLTLWGQVMHICVSKLMMMMILFATKWKGLREAGLTIIGSDNGLLPGQHQAIIWTNTGILLIGPLGTNFNEILIKIHTFSLTKIHLKMSYGKWQPFCQSLNVLIRKICNSSGSTVDIHLLH